MTIHDFKQRIIEWIREKYYFLSFFLFFVLIFLLFFEKSILVTYWYHLDPWFNKPIWELLESGASWNDHVMYPGLWLRLFYVLTASIKVITGMSYFDITKYWFILLSLLQIGLLWLVIRSFYLKKFFSGVIFVVLLLCLANPFVFRRLSLTVRENLAIIWYLWFIFVFIRYRFSKTFLLWIFSWLVYGSNPITSFFLFFSNIGYGILLIITKNYSEIKSWAKQFWLGIVFGSYFLFMFIESLVWQYYHVEAEVIAKNPFPYSYYYIDSKHITMFFIVFLLISVMIFVLRYAKSFADLFRKHSHRDMFMLVNIGMLMVLFAISYSPKIGLYQDRLVMYIVIFTSITMIYFINSMLRYRVLLLLLVSLSLIQISKNSAYVYYSPFDNTQFQLDWYKNIETYTGKLITFNFDENIIFNINHILRIDNDLSSQFKDINSTQGLETFNASHAYLLFVSADTFKELQKDFLIKELLLSWKLKKLEDGNYLYINRL